MFNSHASSSSSKLNLDLAKSLKDIFGALRVVFDHLDDLFEPARRQSFILLQTQLFREPPFNWKAMDEVYVLSCPRVPNAFIEQAFGARHHGTLMPQSR